VANACKAQPFDLKYVRLLEGPFQEALERNRRYLHRLSPDRLLHTFRLNAGLPTSAEPLGGWERPECQLRGHFVGHVLSACALAYSSTGDGDLLAKARSLVAELARCQAALGSGYLSAFPEEFIERAETGRRVWAPWYTLHKVLAGLLDVYLHGGDEQALDAARKMAAWAKRRTDCLSDAQMQEMLKVEFGGMPEVFWDLYSVTGDEDHAALARRFEHRAVLDPLADHRDELRGLHVNTQIPKVIAAARAFELTGRRYCHDAAMYFWREVAVARSYCCGGTSNYECWCDEPYRVAGQLSAFTHENCCTHNMLKLTRHLFAWHADARFADYFERALFNGILPTQHPDDGGAIMYYVPMQSGLFKFFGRPDESYACCNGTGIESFAKLGDSVYFHDDAGVYVNLFIALELRWPEKGLRIRQETAFPEQESTALIIRAAEPVRLDLRIRIPHWATRGVLVTVNGRPEEEAPLPASYLTLARTWQDGDRVEVRLPMSLHLAPMPDDPDLAAVMYGPLVLAGELGADGMTDEMRSGMGQEAYRMNTEGAVTVPPAMVVSRRDPNLWIRPVPGSLLRLRTEGVGRPTDVCLVPFYRLFGQRYGIYWRFHTPEQWQELQDARPALPDGVVDRVTVGDLASEREHNFQAYTCERGADHGRKWVRSKGSFRYDLAVLPDRAMVLECTFSGKDGDAACDIHIDGQRMTGAPSMTETSDGSIVARYSIPRDFTRPTGRVAVMFKVPEGPPQVAVGATTVEKAPAERMTPRLFACAMLGGCFGKSSSGIDASKCRWG